MVMIAEEESHSYRDTSVNDYESYVSISAREDSQLKNTLNRTMAETMSPGSDGSLSEE